MEIFLSLLIFTNILGVFSQIPCSYSIMNSKKYAQTSSCEMPPATCIKSRYRSFNGSCNNLKMPEWGSSKRPYRRLVRNNYDDDIHELPRSITGRQLPNPRQISLQLFPDKMFIDHILTLNTQQFGQLIAHDMSLSAGLPNTQRNMLECCDSKGQLTAEGARNPLCEPILIPAGDPVHSPEGTHCLNFARTLTAKDRQYLLPMSSVGDEPISDITACLDLSVVYGSGSESINRSGQGGRLLTVTRGGQEWPPQVSDVTLTCDGHQMNEPCYSTGDIRANQNPQLTVLTIIFYREHNRIARELGRINPHWDDETIFEEARRINIAEVQHITYYEYLPIILGFSNMLKKSLIYSSKRGYINDYDLEVDPAVLQEHASAAFRHFHTMIRGRLNLITENRELSGSARLSDWFDRPSILEQENSFDNLARGLTLQKNGYSDQYFDQEITNFYTRRNNTFGNDLRAWDIQRARDHGVGSYQDVRRICGLPVPKQFSHLQNYMSKRTLQSIYERIEDVELIVAGSLEYLEEDTEVGPTFLCIISEQFYRTRVGDRFFYENGTDSATAFSIDQLQSIRQCSLSRLFCDNVLSIQRIKKPKAQKKAFA